MPKGIKDGPMARTRIFLVEPAGPWTMNPSIKALSPVPTGSRVETLPTRPGMAVGVTAGVTATVAAGVAVGVAVAVGVIATVALGVAVGVAATGAAGVA